jgi:hypothetical protein
VINQYIYRIIHAKKIYNSTPLDTTYNLCLPQITYTHLWLKAAVVLLRMGAIAPETCRAKNREE